MGDFFTDVVAHGFLMILPYLYLLSVPSVEFYRSDLGTTAISKIYFSKLEQVKVCVKSLAISPCIAQKDG